MPLASRVAPDGALVATPERGLLLGNRGGRFHDPETRTVLGRPWHSRQWICCLLSFKGRSLPVWGPRRYTQLFFCDEVTALAAGHRPCMECRRTEAKAYLAAVAAARGLAAAPRTRELDVWLDAERRDGRAKRLHRLDAATLPDGAMIRDADGRFLALRGGRTLVWSFAGYTAALPRPIGQADVLTPPTSLAALRHGYGPVWHPSVDTL